MSEIRYVKFAINETTYCHWDLDIHARNLDFINSIDPKYFEHIANIHGQFLEGDEKQYAAAALRIAYSHGLENLFALLCAVVQAPNCVVGWVLKYQNKELFEVIRKISERRPLYSRLKAKPVTWAVVADLIFSYLKTGDEDKDSRIRGSFARMWSRFASDYLNVSHTNEYNSIKHGMRAKMGGFYLSLGLQDNPGIPAPPDRMRVLGSSEFGSSFFVPEKLHDGRNFSISHQSLNWNPQNLLFGLHLISASIVNVIGFLKILNGVPAKEVQFSWPSQETAYQEPWNRVTGITSFNWNSQVKEVDVAPFSKEDILPTYDAAEREEKEEDQ
jgi:hypothetical protein